jgi:hypothetical protein
METITLQGAYTAGRAAFEAGLKSAPALDAKFIKSLPVGEVGTAIPFLEEWARGWHNANLATLKA